MSNFENSVKFELAGKAKQRALIVTDELGKSTTVGRYDLVDQSARKKAVADTLERFPSLEPTDIEARLDQLAVGAVGHRTEGEDASSSQADELVVLSQQLFELFPADDGEVYAVRRGGASTAIAMSGGSDSLRACLAAEFYERRKRVPRSSSISDAMLVIGGLAKKQPRRAVFLRCAPVAGDYEIDIGDETGRCIRVTAAGWEIAERATAHFYRTAITLPMAEPERGGTLDELWTVMNVEQRDRPLILAYAITTLMPDREAPILMANGPKGSGKSSIARALTGLCDPTVGATRTPPTSPDQWSVSAAGSRIVAVDNVSAISVWLSDAFCRATTGDAYVGRQLYSNKSLSALQFRIALIITAIDAGAIRDDLGDRCVVVCAPVLDKRARVNDRAIKQRFTAARGRILGALLDLMVHVNQVLPEIVLDELPRIGDFYLVLAAVDRVLGTNGIAAFADQAQRIVEDVIESDPTSTALLAFMQGKSEWCGSAQELLDDLWPNGRAKGTPPNARSIAAVLRRMEPTLLSAGLVVEPPQPNQRPRNWRISWGVGSDHPSSSSDRRTVGQVASAGLPSGFFDLRRSDDVTVGTSADTVGQDAASFESRRSDDADDVSAGQNDSARSDDGWEVFH